MPGTLVIVDAGGLTSIGSFESMLLQVSMVAPGRSSATVELSAAGGLLSTDGTPAASIRFAWNGNVLLGRPRLEVDPLADPAFVELSASVDGQPADIAGNVRFEVDADATLVDVDGESIRISAGWTAGLYADFSADFTYRPDDFPYDAEPEYHDNPPDSFVILEPPFAPGLAIGAGRRIIELGHPDLSYVEHDYTPATNDSGGPDYISCFAFSPAGFDGGGPALLLGATSTLSGDGVYELDPFWTITRPRTYNNTRAIFADPNGLFDATGISDHYVGLNADAQRESDGAVLVTGRVYSGYVATTGDLVMTISDGVTDRVVRLESGTHLTTAIVTANESLFLPTVAPHGTDPPLLILRGNREIGTVEGGAWRTLLENLDPDWWWPNAALAMPGSALAVDGPTLYILSSNRTLDRDRVLRFELP